MNFPEPISDQQIERSLWFINNKPLLKKIAVIILLLTIFILYGFSLFKFISIQTQESFQLDSDPTSIDFQSWNANNQVQTPTVIKKNIISLGDDKYDIVLEVKNPNETIALTQVEYKFTYNNQESAKMTTFFLPGETKKLIDFGAESDIIIRTADIEIVDIKFNRLRKTELDQINTDIFTISDEEMHFNTQDDNVRNWVEFKATNHSPYNWKEAKFIVSLTLGSKLVAINEIKTEQFYSNKEKILKTSWFQKIPSYATLEIESEINILDSENYIDPI